MRRVVLQQRRLHPTAVGPRTCVISRRTCAHVCTSPSRWCVRWFVVRLPDGARHEATDPHRWSLLTAGRLTMTEGVITPSAMKRSRREDDCDVFKDVKDRRCRRSFSKRAGNSVCHPRPYGLDGGGGRLDDLYCSQPPGGDQNASASLSEGVTSSIFIQSMGQTVIQTVVAGSCCSERSSVRGTEQDKSGSVVKPSHGSPPPGAGPDRRLSVPLMTSHRGRGHRPPPLGFLSDVHWDPAERLLTSIQCVLDS
ncbi:unnamed protein product [Pleuronectes platessa]|uniref:Uncharacterized protein n=1 Tax=Pleuronectes platessa TaxID=8262 RepID=A0A9N7UWQ0_PLEPL|nr:unnamed protein product [Pleuronectes platessa]